MDDWFQYFTERYTEYGYPVLFLGVLLENAGIPVPGETAVLVAGFLASPAGGGHFHIGLIIAVTIVAAVIGDNCGYWLGHRWARPRLQAGRRFLFLTPAALQLAEGYFHRYGLWTIFFARFITGLRVVGALAAGTAGMPWRRFLLANAAGALAWSVTMSLLGYFFGHSWEILHKVLGRGGMILLGSIVLLVGLPYVLRRLHRLTPGLWETLARSQIYLGIVAALLEVVCIALLVQLAHGRQATRVDRSIGGWLIPLKPNALADWFAQIASAVGTLPAVTLLTLLAVAWLRYRDRPWRECAVSLWALI
ncbi:MAG TPA: DedA family protein, partial [Gemmataceae bacterium]|nr:DedA family protein [Gemmataceae bacterium]